MLIHLCEMHGCENVLNERIDTTQTQRKTPPIARLIDIIQMQLVSYLHCDINDLLLILFDIWKRSKRAIATARMSHELKYTIVCIMYVSIVFILTDITISCERNECGITFRYVWLREFIRLFNLRWNRHPSINLKHNGINMPDALHPPEQPPYRLYSFRNRISRGLN